MRIHRLATDVANQIAAGEVIERPASVVKELLENALDAKANKIHVEIGFGGLNLVSVSDDGCGIDPDDLLLSIAPHATSKLTQLDELMSIKTMGFRGEALSSIASVACMSIVSKTAGASSAMRLESDQQGVRLLPCARKQGTTIEVRDLFYNASVRKKFLKPEREEYLAIDAVVRRFAFTEPRIALSLAHQGKLSFSLPPAPCPLSMRTRLQKLLGKSFVDKALYLSEASMDLRLEGWVSHPDFSKSQHDKQWVYINQRMVNDKLILNAIKQAYGSFLPPGRYPVCLLYLTINPDQLDVNVHPTKHEVRFHEPRIVHDFIRVAIASILGAPLLEKPVRQSLAVNFSKPIMDEPQDKPFSWFILNATYAVVRRHNDPYLVNFERLAMHRMQKQREAEPMPWVSRPLLVPVSFTLSARVLNAIEVIREQCLAYGLTLDEVKEGSVKVRTIPRGLPQLDLAQFFERLNQSYVEPYDWMREFMLAQSFNLLALDEQDMIDLKAYWEESFTELMEQHPVAIPLTSTRCQEILHA
ncbi:MAG: DNA mismatch repair endonuclease MutL [Legionellaceae bacterium]